MARRALADLLISLYLVSCRDEAARAIDWMIPRKEFYSYLQRLVDAGLCDQVMYGSDQMMWPDTIPYSIKAVKEAGFLSSEQRQDILINNAVKFLRLETG